MHFGVVYPRPIDTRQPSDFGFAATLQGRPFVRRHSFGGWSLQHAIGVICGIEEREFPAALIKDGRGLVRSVDPTQMATSQPSPSLDNHRQTRLRDLIRDIDIAGRSRLGGGFPRSTTLRRRPLL
jgi:hypothetical protein